MIRVYTSATKSYLPKARVLAQSIKRYHPEYFVSLLFSDSLPDSFDLEKEDFDEVVTIAEIPHEAPEVWKFKHTVVELCTAVKGWGMKRLLEMPDTDGVFYFDPDIMLTSRVDSLEADLKTHDVLLTPHMLHPETDLNLIHGNEIVSVLAHGIYNLGFVGASSREQGKEFASWWNQRLMHFCFDDVPSGLFTDQRWCDLVPCFFDRHKIIRDSGCNVATWNLLHRPVTRENGHYLAGGVPLKFYHFTGYDSGQNFRDLLPKISEGSQAIYELWDEYAEALDQCGHGSDDLKSWAFFNFDNGDPIPKKARQIYRMNKDLQKQFNSPFTVSEDGTCFYAWCKDQGLLNGEDHLSVDLLRRELFEIYNSRSWKLVMKLKNIVHFCRRAPSVPGKSR